MLGRLEYVNRDGGWWQGTASIAGQTVRLDLNCGVHVSDVELASGQRLLGRVQLEEARARSFAVSAVAAERGEIGPGGSAAVMPQWAAHIQPVMIVLWMDSAEIRYACSDGSEGGPAGWHELAISVGEDGTLSCPSLRKQDLYSRACQFLERPTPADVGDFENSLADQIIVKAVEQHPIQLDSELRSLIAEAIEGVEQRVRTGSEQSRAYLSEARTLLQVIAQTPQTVIEFILVAIRVMHPEGKRMPFKQRLNFAPGDRAAFLSIGEQTRVEFFTIRAGENDSVEEIHAAVRDRLDEATRWLARQTPTVFEELRAAGFSTEMFINAVARIAGQPVELHLPARFMEQCGRLGLALFSATRESTRL